VARRHDERLCSRLTDDELALLRELLDKLEAGLRDGEAESVASGAAKSGGLGRSPG
jgi:hypothetical protein